VAGGIIISTLQYRILALALVSCIPFCAKTVENPVGPDVFAHAIQALGGRVVSPSAYPNTVPGFQRYLSDTGISAVSAAELTRPNHPEVAVRLGFQLFLPRQAWWSRGAALALLTQSIESNIGADVRIRNWWRPAAYNRDPVVGGAANGDHPSATAVDLDYASALDRARAERFLRDLNSRCPWMRMSLGVGAQTTHVGIGSPRGHREWRYPSLAITPAGLRS